MTDDPAFRKETHSTVERPSITWPNRRVVAWENGVEEAISCVGKGWEPIIRSLMEDLASMGWNGHLSQVKEKFGGLRFYIGGASPEIYKRVDAAEAESYLICERCGGPGTTKPSSKWGWILTLCDPCRDRRMSGDKAKEEVPETQHGEEKRVPD